MDELLPNGLTLRQHFALETFKGMLAGGSAKAFTSTSDMVQAAVRRADELLSALEKPHGG